LLAYARAFGMGPFDYLFSFYGLLLGIAIANVAIGFADMWRDSDKIAVGTCPPLLACLVLLGGMNAWLQIWHEHQYVALNAWQMLAATAISLPYVFISRAMFPGAGEETERSLEDHYLKHHALLLVLLAIPVVVQTISKVALDGVRDQGWEEAWMVVRIAAPLALIPFKGRTAQRVGLAAMNVLLLVGLFR
jgi:hypothetical protein